jgi:hypothetical protein
MKCLARNREVRKFRIAILALPRVIGSRALSVVDSGAHHDKG